MRNYLVFLVVVALVLFLWAGLGFGALRYYDRDERVSGPWGDTFGAVNALFTGLGFAGLLYTIWLQHREIESANSEAKRTAELNALIALAEHSGRAYERAVELRLSPQETERYAKALDEHLLRLSNYVGENTGSATSFTSIEQSATSRPNLVVQVGGIKVLQHPTQDPRLEVTINIQNASTRQVTLTSVDLYVQVDNDILQVSFSLKNPHLPAFEKVTLTEISTRYFGGNTEVLTL